MAATRRLNRKNPENLRESQLKAMATTRRRPTEAIEARNNRSAECERRVRSTVTKLSKLGLPFTVEEVCRRANVGKTFIYDKRRPELTRLVLEARDVSQQAKLNAVAESCTAATASWHARALNAESQVKQLRQQLRAQDQQISDLTGQLFDPDGNHLAAENTRLRDQIDVLNSQLTRLNNELAIANRSLSASRASVRREQERNLKLVSKRMSPPESLSPSL